VAHLSLEMVLEATGGRLQGPTDSINGLSFTAVSTDSRSVRAGELFVALKGQRYDGHDFVVEAMRRGAAAAIVSEPIAAAGAGAAVLIQVNDTLEAMGRIAAAHRSRFALPVVAITGSVGKTTTKEMTAQILSQRFRVLKTEENYNNEIGVPLTALKLEPSHQAAVFEIAMRGPGEIAWLARIIKPGIGLVTNISVTHIERLGSIGAIAAAKAELLREMSADSAAILNADDDNSRAMQAAARGKVVTFGVNRPADVTAREVSVGPTGAAQFRLVTGKGESLVRLAVPGRHNVANALAAAAAALQAGASMEDARLGLESAALGKHRLQIITSARGFTILDDCYNANPDSMIAALEVLGELQARRRMAVLGDMLELGPKADEMHRLVGREAAKCGLALLVVAGDFARQLREGALEGMAEDQVIAAGDVGQCAEIILRAAGPGDAVLVKASRAVAFERIVERLASG